ncbi:MAG TPA: dihydroneopterin aldolase [Bacteroidales bacterium]|nr:dihydroneopterin aldolase [Bacteroidales bacterium]
MAKIILDDMEFYAHHGCLLEEQLIGARFIVNLEFEYDSSIAEVSDKIEDAVNYQQLYKIVKGEMKKNSKLIEAVANRIASEIQYAFPEIQYLLVRVSKLNPPVGGKVKSVGVVIERRSSSLGKV